ncbi:MAG: class I SAM-dependent methyltransferase [Planctomycetota bacterium]
MAPPAGDPLKPYRDAVARSGPGFDALLWRSRDYQHTRFRVLCEVAAGGLTDQGLADATVADLGCGRADLLLWMQEHGMSVRGYVGVEAIPELADESRRAASDLTAPAEIIESDFAADETLFERLASDHGVTLCLFSGSLNTFDQKRAERVIDRAWQAGVSVVFNFLSDAPSARRPEPGDPASRFKTARLLSSFAERVDRIAFRRDYLPTYDATIGLFQKPSDQKPSDRD